MLSFTDSLDTFNAAYHRAFAKPEPWRFGIPKEPAAPDPVPLFDLTAEAVDAATIEERDAIITDLEKWGALKLPVPDKIAIRFPQEKIAEVLGWEPNPKLRHVYATMAISGEPLKVETHYLWKGRLPPKELPLDKQREWLEAHHTENGKQVSQKELDDALKLGLAVPRRLVIPQHVYSQVFYETRRGSPTFDINKKGENSPTMADSIKRDFWAMACEALTILLASLAARNIYKDVRYNGEREVRGKSRTPCYYGPNDVIYLSRTVVRPPKPSELKDFDPEHPPKAERMELMLVRGFIRNQVADTTVPQPADVKVTVIGNGREGRRLQWIAPYYRGADPDYFPKPRHYVVK